MKTRIYYVTAMAHIVSLLSTLLLISKTTLAENSVLLKAKMQKATSSTLKWVTPSGEPIPRDAVVGSVHYIPIGINENDLSRVNITDRSQIRNEKIYVCRTRVNGNWVPGAIYEGTKSCVVSVILRVFTQPNYEVLRNVEQAARLVWKDWEWSSETPDGAVSSGDQPANDYYVAHSPSKNLRIFTDKLAVGVSFLMGKVDPNEGVFGKLSVVDENRNVISDVEKGQVLVELEPMLYELTVTKLNTDRRKVIGSSNIKLAEVTLRNDLLSPMDAESVMTFQWRYNSSWGQGRAMLKGLSTKVYFTNSSTVENISWGLTYEEIKDGIESVKAKLEAGTGLHVTLQGTLYEVEVPYTASLLSVFNDSATMKRTIYGTWLRTELVDIETSFGPMYYLHNNSIVPTSSTTTTNTVETSTSSTTVTVSTPQYGGGVNENVIPSTLPPTPGQGNDESNSLNDDSDALQLKKKDDHNSAASGISKSIVYLLCSVLLLSFH